MLLLRLWLPYRPIVATARRLLRLARRLGVARRHGPAVALPIHGGGIGAARSATAPAATATLTASAAAATFGQKVFRDLRLGVVVLFRRYRRESGRPSGHADLRVPHGPELIWARRRRGRLFAFLDFSDFALDDLAALADGLGPTVATATTAAPAPAATRGLGAAFGRLAFALALRALHEFMGGLIDDLVFGRFAFLGADGTG